MSQGPGRKVRKVHPAGGTEGAKARGRERARKRGKREMTDRQTWRNYKESRASEYPQTTSRGITGELVKNA